VLATWNIRFKKKRRCWLSQYLVQPLDMVDNSTSPYKLVLSQLYPHSAVQVGCFIL
jgi:hypothetical protein